jgi:hypothetical protein
MENKIHVPNHQPVVSSTVKMLIQWDAIGIIWISWGYEIWAMFLSENGVHLRNGHFSRLPYFQTNPYHEQY